MLKEPVLPCPTGDLMGGTIVQSLCVEHKKKKKILYAWLIGLLSLTVVFTAALCFFHADTFSVSKIKPRRDFSFQATPTVSHKEIEELRTIISQPFTYLSEGPESYVFASQDGKYVIKFFKMRRMTPKYWLNYIPLPWLEKKRLSKIEERERVRHECFGGLKIAFEKFKYQTGCLFLHLFRTQYLRMKVVVQDNEEKWHEIPLDQVPFLMQKRVTMLPEYIQQLMDKGKKEDVIRHLCQLLDLMKITCYKGYIPVSEEIEVDYGFLEDRPIYVEALYAKEEGAETTRSIIKSIFSLSKALQSWLSRHYPELVVPFQEGTQDVLSCLDED